MRLLAVLVVLLVFLVPFASAGNIFTFSGRVTTTSSGNALTSGNIGITLYTAATGGTPFFWEAFDSNINSDGYFSVLVGSTRNLDLNYGTVYYLDFNVNNEDFDFGGSERTAFESAHGNIPDNKLSSNIPLLNSVISFLNGVSFLSDVNFSSLARFLNAIVQNDLNVSAKINTQDFNVGSGNIKVNGTTYAISDLNRNAQTTCSGDSNSVLNSIGQCVSLSNLDVKGGIYANKITVAKTGGDYNSLWTAITTLKTAGTLNNTTIQIQPGTYYDSRVIDINGVQNVSIIGTDTKNTIITSESFTGTIYVNDANNILIKGLHIINTGSGFGDPPQAALQIGPEAGTSTGLHNIYIEDNFIEGVHDGIQLQGYSAPKTYEPYWPTIWVKNNYIVSAHDVLTMKRASRIYSSNNFLIADANLLDSNAQAADPWKTTGMHFNFSGITDANNSYFRSTGDVIRVKNGTSSPSDLQDNTAGILLYIGSSNGNQKYNEITFDGAQVDVVETYAFPLSTSRKIGGVVVTQNVKAIPSFNFLNGFISVRQENPDSNAKAYGLIFDVLADGNYSVNIVNTDVNYYNAGTGGAQAVFISNIVPNRAAFKFINLTGINNFATDINDSGNNGTYQMTNRAGQTSANGFWYKTTQGVTSSSYFLCTTNNCSATCRPDFNGGIPTGCT